MLLVKQNPLLPAWYDVVWTGVVVIVLAFAVAAIVSILRAKTLTGARAIVWLLVVLALPVLGGLAWFAAGKPRPMPGQPQPTGGSAD